MLSENAKDIPGYEGLYAVTEDGRVYSHSRVVKAAHGSTQLRKGRWLKQHENNKGYLYLPLSVDGVKVKWLVHRLVALAFVPNPEGKPFINHIDNNRKNNNASNLEWCTQKENMKHCSSQGRVKFPSLKGENNPISKLSYEQVIEIKKSKGVNQRELAKKYCVSQTVIHNIQSGKSWRHVNG